MEINGGDCGDDQPAVLLALANQRESQMKRFSIFSIEIQTNKKAAGWATLWVALKRCIRLANFSAPKINELN